MNDETYPQEEAAAVANLLHQLLRRLTTGDHDESVIDLPLAQLRLCNALRGKARPMSAISRELGTSLSAVTQIADRLERAQLVKRVPRGDDRRVRCLQLTEQGEKMMRRHEENRVQRMSQVLDNLTPEERQVVVSAFQMMVRAAGRMEERNGESLGLKVHFASDKVLT